MLPIDAINKARNEHVEVASVGNPGLQLATGVGGVPGMPAMVTHKLGKRMEELGFPAIPEFLELIHDSGAGLDACKIGGHVRTDERRLHRRDRRGHHRRRVL